MSLITPSSQNSGEANKDYKKSIPTRNRIASILRESNIDSATLIFLQMVDESAERQIHMLGITEPQKVLIKNNLIPHLKSLVTILDSHEEKGNNSNTTHGYLQSPDIGIDTSVETYTQDLINPEKTQIGIYLWRIPNKGSLIKTINHELNHLFLRYSIGSTHTETGDDTMKHIFEENNRFPIILECFGFLSGAEAGIVSGEYSQKKGLETAEEGSDRNMDDPYTQASVLAKRILEVQLIFGNQTGSKNPDFIRYCQQVRHNLYQSISNRAKFDTLLLILDIKKPDFGVTNSTLSKMLDWAGME